MCNLRKFVALGDHIKYYYWNLGTVENQIQEIIESFNLLTSYSPALEW